jgi:DNA-binding transcriptional MocR family regulator
MFDGVSNKPQPGAGVLPHDWLQTTFLATAVRRSCTAVALNSFSLQYGEPQGDMGLRRASSTKLAGIAVQAGPEQIITTVSATQALTTASPLHAPCVC